MTKIRILTSALHEDDVACQHIGPVVTTVPGEPFLHAKILFEIRIFTAQGADTRVGFLSGLVQNRCTCYRIAHRLQCHESKIKHIGEVGKADKLCGVWRNQPLVCKGQSESKEKRKDNEHHDQKNPGTGHQPSCKIVLFQL